MKSSKFFNIFLAVSLVLFPFARTEGMQSSNYIIEKDSINFSGTEESGSASYKLSDTAGEIGTGEGQCSGGSCNFLLGGYRQGDTVSGSTISISPATDVTLSPSISGVGGGVGDGNTAWTVTTDNAAGYQLSIKARTTPALQSGSYTFADYVPGSSDPDYNWSVASSASEFGYSVEGAHTASEFLDNGAGVCNSGSGNVSDKCWRGFSMSDEAIATSILPNSPAGTATTVKFRAEAGSQKMQQEGSYVANIVVTAVTL